VAGHTEAYMCEQHQCGITYVSVQFWRNTNAPEMCLVLLTSLVLRSGCAGVRLSEVPYGTDDEIGVYLIHILHQNIVFVDSVLNGLEPPVDTGILNVRNSIVRFVRLTVKFCTLSGTRSSTLNLGGSKHGKWQSLSVQDSHFTQNSGNMALGVDGFLIRQTTGKLLINNTRFIGNNGSVGVTSLSPGVYSAFFGLKIDSCTFRDNSASSYGACVQVFGATAEVLNCSFENNQVASGLGGVLWVSSPLGHYRSPCR
jgi:hypothetical protein